jgi:broad specificity phosphatase PhoE
MKIYLTRHGETLGNKDKIHEGGRLHGKLSDLGLEQARKLALRLKDENIDYVYSSDLRRAKQTAKEIMKYHQKTPIKFIKDLREMDLGSFTGKHFDEVDWNKTPKNLESNENAQMRALKFIDKTYPKHKNDSILIVAHAFFNKALISGIQGKETSVMKEIEQKNTCVNIIEIREDKKHIIHLLNCIKHLE